MVMKKRGQVAFEYILIFSFIMLVTMGFMGLIASRVVSVQNDNDRETRDNIITHIMNYAELAMAADDGFSAQFVLPPVVDSINYSISISDDSILSVEFADDTNSYILPERVAGKFCYDGWDKTEYLINVRKVEGIVEVSSCDNCTVSYQVCDEAEESGDCAALSPDELEQCRKGYCKCLS
ncbi:MAG: hypothetical protein ACOCQX_01240 [Candidatus Nanoarchaeia archaeon]